MNWGTVFAATRLPRNLLTSTTTETGERGRANEQQSHTPRFRDRQQRHIIPPVGEVADLERLAESSRCHGKQFAFVQQVGPELEASALRVADERRCPIEQREYGVVHRVCHEAKTERNGSSQAARAIQKEPISGRRSHFDRQDRSTRK